MERFAIENTQKMGRRQFLRLSIGAASTLLGVSYAGLFGDFLLPSAEKASYPLQEVGKLFDFPVDTPRLVSYKGKNSEEGAYVINLGETKGFIALDFHCTHLECGVNWIASSKQFICPCHGGVYDMQGKVMSGPPPKNLSQRVIKLVGNSVMLGGRMG